MNDLTTLIRRAQQAADAAFCKECDGLTPRQYAALKAIADTPGCCQTDVVRETGIDRSTITDLVRRLVRRGMVKRVRRKDDARAYVLTVTEYGAKFLRIGATVTTNIEDQLIRSVPPLRRKSFIADLAAISSPVKEAAE